jgi:hypothetical protein
VQNILGDGGPKGTNERSSAPLWFAIAGLLIVMFSRSMQDEMIGDVVAWVGAAFTMSGLFYWFVRPTHGMR